MAKKVPTPPAGAPAWVVTYGDLMSLLMCFFVLLFSMSSLEAEKMAAAVESLNSAFNMGSGDGRSSHLETVRERIRKLDRGRRRGDGDEKFHVAPPVLTDKQGGDESPHGEEAMLQFVPKLELGPDKGYLVQFKYGDDGLGLKGKLDLKKIHAGLVGLPNRIILKAHTAFGEAKASKAYRHGIDLAYVRAVNVRDYLVSLGLKENQFQMLVVGEYEPLHRSQLPAGIDPKEADAVVVIAISPAHY